MGLGCFKLNLGILSSYCLFCTPLHGVYYTLVHTVLVDVISSEVKGQQESPLMRLVVFDLGTAAVAVVCDTVGPCIVVTVGER